jgi:hypothetical protein
LRGKFLAEMAQETRLNYQGHHDRHAQRFRHRLRQGMKSAGQSYRRIKRNRATANTPRTESISQERNSVRFFTASLSWFSWAVQC